MKILLLLGDSGTGKTSISKALFVNYNYFYLIKSYTTRFKRNLYDNDHIFIRKNNLLYKMFHDKVVASTIINNELYCSFEEQFKKDRICIYTVDDKGFLDVVNYFGIDNVCAIRLKRNNINVNKERGERNLNQIIPDSCSNLHIVENNTTINDCCLNIISILREKWPSFFDDFYSV